MTCLYFDLFLFANRTIWNDILFYWYQSYHWYQWTIGLTNRICLCVLDMCEKFVILS